MCAPNLETLMNHKVFRDSAVLVLIILNLSVSVVAQSGATRPRRVDPATTNRDAAAAATPQPTPAPNAPARSVPAPTNTATRPATNAVAATGSTAQAYALLQQKQYAGGSKRGAADCRS
jgi:hypothetical protein